jgi:hypothetical protein
LLTNLMQLYHAAARDLSAKHPPAFEPPSTTCAINSAN